MAGVQGPTWFQILSNILGDTNEGRAAFCSNTAHTSLSDFCRKKEKRIRKLTKDEGETDEASVNGECSRMDEKDDNDT